MRPGKRGLKYGVHAPLRCCNYSEILFLGIVVEVLKRQAGQPIKRRRL